MTKIVDFPIYPHLKKFILKFYDLREGEVVQVGMNNSIGIAMKHVIREKKPLQRDIEKMTDRIQFELCTDIAHCEIRYSYIIAFNKSYNKVFKDHLILWIKAQAKAGINARQSVINFLKEYELDENEYSYDSAYRHWTRFKSPKKRREKLTV